MSTSMKDALFWDVVPCTFIAVSRDSAATFYTEEGGKHNPFSETFLKFLPNYTSSHTKHNFTLLLFFSFPNAS
jgi:hypothetical protein